MGARLVFAILLSLLAATAHADTLLILPFENARRDPRLDWIGEGLAELTLERLSGEGRTVFPREEWLAAVDRLGLPASSRFSRATMLKVAEEIDADFVIFGSYASDGKTITITANVLRSYPPGLSPPLVESGALEDLMEVHARLAWRILRHLDAAYPLSQHDYVQQFPRRRLDAFENYVRGLLAQDEQHRLRLFREAARLEPDWPEPAFALGQAYFMRQECEAALIWLSRVPPVHERGAEAAFNAGVCHLLRNDLARAEAAFAGLEARADISGRLPEALNNLAVAKARFAEAAGTPLARVEKLREAMTHWERATRLDSEDTDYWFNLGLVALRLDEPAAAVRPFREVLRRTPGDHEARALLVAALERSGRATQAAAEREASPVSLPALGPDARLPAERVKKRLEPMAFHQPGGDRGPAVRRRAQHVGLHLTRGRDFLSAGKLEEARREFAEAVLLAPETAEAHAGLAEVYARQGRAEEAIRELRAAIWHRDDAAMRTRLARLYIEQDRSEEARAELQAALRLDPGNVEARRLLDSLATRRGSGERP